MSRFNISGAVQDAFLRGCAGLPHLQTLHAYKHLTHKHFTLTNISGAVQDAFLRGCAGLPHLQALA